ncbi:MAG: hypothetical protein RBS99_15185 [Rhodospirillales bacterium]|jgi:hypothetical protein|nr:hypothetical protein [Rhodospirillales bacterium]
MTGGANRALFRLAVAAALVLTTGGAPSVAGPGYVFYYRTFGDWTVVCALDEPTGRKDCRLGAPSPQLAGTGGDVGASLDIVGPPASEPAIVLRVAAAIADGRPAVLTVDGHAGHQAALARTGEAAWHGAEARAILAEMSAGQTVSIRFVRWNEPAEAERRFSLTGFAPALQTYRQQLAAIGGQPR